MRLSKLASLLNWKYLWYGIVFFIWVAVIGLLAFSKGNLTDANFWYDESGQFWMAKGLNHFSPPHAPSGNIIQVLINNAQHNLDPGGFTVLLHYWTMISTTPIFLRLLPFTFFVLSMIIVSKISLLWFPKHPLSYFSGFILLHSDLLKHEAFELRAYSMEMCTAIAALYFCHKIPIIFQSKKYAFFVGIVMAILLTARYSAIFPAMILGLMITYFMVRNFKKQYITHFLLYTLPVVFSMILVYFVTLQHQNPGTSTPDYVKAYLLKSGDIYGIAFNAHVLWFVLPAVFTAFCTLVLFKKAQYVQYRYFVVYVLLLNLVFCVLSVLGKYPWAFNTKWDMSTHTLFVIALLPAGYIMLECISRFHLALGRISQIIVTLSFVIFLGFKANAFVYAVNANDTAYFNFSYYTSHKPLIRSDAKILANQEASPTLRYLFEYGPLQSKKNIYNQLSFFVDTRDITNNIIVDNNTIDNYDYVILSQYSASYIQTLLAQHPNWIESTMRGPSLLFRNSAKQ